MLNNSIDIIQLILAQNYKLASYALSKLMAATEYC